MRLLIIDNYDSFTYNLVHIVENILNRKIDVFRNNEIELNQIENYDKIILSPGPGLPKDAGIMPDLIPRYSKKKSILGVCLGHQAIAEAFGAKLKNLDSVFHGVSSNIHVIGNDKLFHQIPTSFSVGRYHSWIVSDCDFPESLIVTAKDDAGSIMAFAHNQFDVRGVQFHPESIMTEYGAQLLKNWLQD